MPLIIHFLFLFVVDQPSKSDASSALVSRNFSCCHNNQFATSSKIKSGFAYRDIFGKLWFKSDHGFDKKKNDIGTVISFSFLFSFVIIDSTIHRGCVRLKYYFKKECKVSSGFPSTKKLMEALFSSAWKPWWNLTHNYLNSVSIALRNKRKWKYSRIFHTLSESLLLRKNALLWWFV